MLRNLVAAERKAVTKYGLVFDDGYGNGYEFPCDEHGVALDNLPDIAARNLERCLKHPERFERFNEIISREVRWTEPAHGICECGYELFLYDQYCGACQCGCGRWYNLFGQELMPPECW